MSASAAVLDDMIRTPAMHPSCVEQREGLVRIEYASFSGVRHTANPATPLSDQQCSRYRALLDSSIDILEFRRVVAGMLEAFQIAETNTIGDALDKSSEIMKLADKITRIDVVAVVQRMNPQTALPVQLFSRDQPLSKFDFDAFLNSSSSLLEVVPLDDILYLGDHFGLEKEAHRCRTSYNWLANFITRHRNQDREAPSLHAMIGRFYMQGGVEVQEAADVLKMDTSDCAAFLERNGYVRNLETIRLSNDDRQRKLETIMAQKHSPNTSNNNSERATERETIASQRIEGIDARSWYAID